MSVEHVPLRICRLPHADGIDVPHYASDGAAGMDVRAAIDDPLAIPPGQVSLVPTGLRVEIPLGFELQVRPRSGLALKHRLAVLNSPGTIDSDYRGEIGIIVCNLGDESFVVERGDRIAQMVLARHARAEIVLVADVDTTDRGAGGFGHTGIS